MNEQEEPKAEYGPLLCLLAWLFFSWCLFQAFPPDPYPYVDGGGGEVWPDDRYDDDYSPF